MSHYLDVVTARATPGLRLVLTTGVPGPWGESARSIFWVKGIPYTKVRQTAGEPNEDLIDWTGHANAPQVVLDDEPARTGWAEILFLAERIQPDPPLLPEAPGLRADCLGLSHEICGEEGLGWSRRLMLLAPVMGLPEDPANPVRVMVGRLGRRYGWREGIAPIAEARVCSLLEMLAARLRRQREAGSEYFVGDGLTVTDIHWACFAALFGPLPEEQCPMDAFLRAQYEQRTPAVEAALDPILIEHRDRVYARHLELPIDL